MNEETLVETLQDAGLSPYQAEAYVSLLQMGSGTAMEIAGVSGVPDPRIYDVLRDLEAEGHVELYEQDTLRARVRDPEEVIETLESRAARFEAATDAIEDRWRREEMAETAVSVVKRFDTVLREAQRAIESANSQVRVCVSPANLPRLASALEGALERDVGIALTLYTSGETESVPDPATLAPLCTEARHRALASPFVALVDRSRTFFFPHSDSIETYGALVDDPTYAHVFHWFFITQLWDGWEPIQEPGDELPREYVDVRDCVRDLGPLLEGGAQIELEARGTDVESGTERTVRGVVTSVETTTLSPDNRAEASALRYAGKVTITVDTDDGVVDVGGWGATLEDVEAHRLFVRDVR